jgi:hypothetical protein
MNAKLELQWQILNDNNGQKVPFSVLYLYFNFAKIWDFSKVNIVNEAPEI